MPLSPPRRIRRHHQPNALKLVSATLASLVFMAACSTASDNIDGVFVDVAEIATFGTIAELVEASSVIMEGEVVSVVRGRVSVVPELEDFASIQMLDVTIASIDQLAGEPADRITIEWMGWEIGDDGSPGPQFLVEGMPPPKVGDKAIWFFRSRPNPPAGSAATHSIASLDGRLDIAADGTVTTQIIGENQLATRLSGTRVDDIKTAVKDTLWH